MSDITTGRSDLPQEDPYEIARLGIHPGCEFDWYAADAVGQVAILTTAGYGPVPVSAFRDRAGYELVHRFFGTIPLSTTARLVRPLPPTPSILSRLVGLLRFEYGRRRSPPPSWDHWLEMAARGLFAYDFDLRFELGDAYRIVAVPEAPVRLESLPGTVRQWLLEVRFPGNFAEQDVYDPRQIFDCV
jgi:hypothetical protein